MSNPDKADELVERLAAYVKSHFRYDPETGILERTKKDNGHTILPIISKNGNGYLHCQAEGRKWYCVHQLAWLLTYGSLPKNQIDHINGDRTDNRLANLREANAFQNQWNAKRRRDNTSGYKGVCRGRNGKWLARIKQFNKRIDLGAFDTPEQAHEAYCAAARERFGEYSNSGALR